MHNQEFTQRSFPETLIAIAKHKGDPYWKKGDISQADMTRLLKVKPNYVHRWLNGTSISQEYIEHIAKKLNLSTGQILGKEPIPGVDYPIVYNTHNPANHHHTPTSGVAETKSKLTHQRPAANNIAMFQEKFEALEPAMQSAALQMIESLLDLQNGKKPK